MIQKIDYLIKTINFTYYRIGITLSLGVEVIFMRCKEDRLIELLNKIDISIWGVSDITDLDVYNRKYIRAISIGQAYSCSLKTYTPTGFHDFLFRDIKGNIDSNISIIEEFLKKENIEYHVVTNFVPDRNKCIGEFSNKFAAVRSGLGWIGKNTLLITPEYGPHVRLSTIFVNIELPITKKSREFKGCGDCTICKDICPKKCIKGVNWREGLSREDLIDITECKDRLGNKGNSICALCLVACPIGRV